MLKRSIRLLKSLSERGRWKNCRVSGDKKWANTQPLATRVTTTSFHDSLDLGHLQLIISHTGFGWYHISRTYEGCDLFEQISCWSDSKQAYQTWPLRIDFFTLNWPSRLHLGSIFCWLNLVLGSICGHHLLIHCHWKSAVRDLTIPAQFRQRTRWDQWRLPHWGHQSILGSGRVFWV